MDFEEGQGTTYCRGTAYKTLGPAADPPIDNDGNQLSLTHVGSGSTIGQGEALSFS